MQVNLGGLALMSWCLPEQQAQACYIKGSEKCSSLTLSAAHEHLNQLEFLLILNLYSMGQTSGLEQNSHNHRTCRGIVAWPIGQVTPKLGGNGQCTYLPSKQWENLLNHRPCCTL